LYLWDGDERYFVEMNANIVGLNEVEVIQLDVQLYPNPASSMVETSFNLFNSKTVTIEITDIKGRVIQTSSEAYQVGQHKVLFDLNSDN